MQEFDFYQDVKVTCWVRQRFFVEASSEEEAVKMVENLADTDVCESDLQFNVYETEFMNETSESMSVEENDGCSTIEVYNSRRELICKNGK